ncbi:hypothetical protein WH50_14020 [Pokkaliibacter plantistimulans]|uniref:Uncharacterized protein n=1 Tax=Pokkaliibacter plantistimulans TaxID=1635171 RepID=A0ABX5LVN4_9GAMM|nr:hypothetical protein WH50_14020 [Pokkaliibacter plantistimulans]
MEHKEQELYTFNIRNKEKFIVQAKSENLGEINWFTENKKAILDDELSVLQENMSIAESIKNFYENIESKTDEEVDRVYEYRTTHGLRFAFRGQDIDDIYIGKISEDRYEISEAGGTHWSITIDINDFFHQLNNEIARHM